MTYEYVLFPQWRQSWVPPVNFHEKWRENIQTRGEKAATFYALFQRFILNLNNLLGRETDFSYLFLQEKKIQRAEKYTAHRSRILFCKKFTRFTDEPWLTPNWQYSLLYVTFPMCYFVFLTRPYSCFCSHNIACLFNIQTKLIQTEKKTFSSCFLSSEYLESIFSIFLQCLAGILGNGPL